MCDPVTLTLTATALATGIGAYGQYQQGKYQQKVAKNNSIVLNRMAEDARARGSEKEQQHRMRVAQMKSKQRAAVGASGRDISGSASDLLADTAMMGELDALTIRANADREAYGHEVGATNELAQGKLDRMRGNYGAMGTLLSGGGQFASQWKQYK